MRQLTKQADITVALGEQLQSEADYLAELANRREPGFTARFACWPSLRCRH